MEYTEYKMNPFIEGLLQSKELTSKTVSHSKLKSIEEESRKTNTIMGDVIEQHILRKNLESVAGNILIDCRPFTKLFNSHSIMLADLNPSALKVLMWLMDQLSINSDRVTIKVADVMSFYNYNTTPPIYNGIRELIKKDIIAKAYATNEYFINPKIYFNGSINNVLYDYVINKYNVPNDPESARSFISSVLRGGDVQQYLKIHKQNENSTNKNSSETDNL